MGIFLFPSPNSWGSVRDQMVQIIQRVSLCQRGADIQDFACDFLAVINDLDYQDNNDLKEVFNSCLDEPLSPWEMVRLGTLTFWEFVYQIYHHGGHDSLGLEEPPLVHYPNHNPSPPMTRKRRRRKNGPTSSATSTEEDTAPPEAANDIAAVPPEAPDDTAAPPVVAEYAAASPEAADNSAVPPEVGSSMSPPRPRKRRRRKSPIASPNLVILEDLTSVVPETPSMVVLEPPVISMEVVPKQPTVTVCPIAVEEATFSLYVAAVMYVWAEYTSQLVSSSPVSAPEAVPEPTPDPEVVREPSIFLVSPEMAKRAVFTFYVLAVLRACKMLMLASDHGPVCRPDPVAYQKGIPEQHALPVMNTEAVPELTPAPRPP